MSPSLDAREDTIVPPSRGWFVPAIIAAWTIVGVLMSFADRPLRDALWIVMDLVWLLYALAGIGILVALIWRIGRRREALRRALSPVALVVLGAGLFLTAPTIAEAGDAFWFQRHFDALEPTYRSIAERVSAGTHLSASDTAGIRLVLDAGPPLRVAFKQPGGIIDNWEGVVYDPTGAVGAATGWRDGVPGNYSAPVRVRALFGGDLVACRHVRASFYRCWFT
jgi:hypothetical protein